MTVYPPSCNFTTIPPWRSLKYKSERLYYSQSVVLLYYYNAIVSRECLSFFYYGAEGHRYNCIQIYIILYYLIGVHQSYGIIVLKYC